MSRHHYIERQSGECVAEVFYGDPVVSFLYSRVREQSGWLYRALTSARMTHLLGLLRFDRRPRDPERMRRHYARSCGVDYSECAEPVETLDTARKVFERKIRYWECRPLSPDPYDVVAPADARVGIGSLREGGTFCLKDKLFQYEELLGLESRRWHDVFRDGEAAVFRLTPDKYHWNHVPVTGCVEACYEIEGRYQSCHPAVLVSQVTPHSKNRRIVTILDTDREGGSRVGYVAMIEIVALMIGDIAQRYSPVRYDDPCPLQPGMTLVRGCPKSLFRPGSSTVVLLFERGRMVFSKDLVLNQNRCMVPSLYSQGWGTTWVETDVAVRSTIGRAAGRDRP